MSPASWAGLRHSPDERLLRGDTRTAVDTCPMRFYAERPFRLLREVLADLLVVAWVVLCVAIASLGLRAVTPPQ